MADSRKLTGYSWHSEFLKKDELDDRRDRRRCCHFFKNGSNQGCCSGGHFKCIGSSHCSYYKEKVELNANSENNSYLKIILPLKKNEIRKSVNWKVGDQVTHKKWGVGTITAIKCDNLTIRFENYGYGEKILKADYAPIEKI